MTTIKYLFSPIAIHRWMGGALLSAICMSPTSAAFTEQDALDAAYRNTYLSFLQQVLNARKEDAWETPRDPADAILNGYVQAHRLQQGRQETTIRHLPRLDASQRTRGIGWLTLAEQLARQGQPQKALKSLSKAGKDLPQIIHERRLLLEADILLQLNKPKQAIVRLKKISQRSSYAPFARYNEGVAYISAGAAKKGVAVLESLSRYKQPQAELTNLIDQTHLTLARYYGKRSQFKLARQHLFSIRLDGTSSEEALLTLAMVEQQDKKADRALPPLLLLREQNSAHPAVQNGALLMPSVLEELKAYTQALVARLAQITQLQRSIKATDRAIEYVNNKPFITELMNQENGNTTRPWQPPILTKVNPEAALHLITPLSSHKVQTGKETLAQLYFLRQLIQLWRQDIPYFSWLTSKGGTALDAQLQRLRGSLTGKTSSAQKLERQIEQLIGKPNSKQAQQRILQGMAQWRLGRAFSPISQKTRATQELTQLEIILNKSQKYTQNKILDLKRRQLNTIKKRLSSIDSRLEKTIHKVEKAIQNIANIELVEQRHNLEKQLFDAAISAIKLFEQAQLETRNSTWLEVKRPDGSPILIWSNIHNNSTRLQISTSGDSRLRSLKNYKLSYRDRPAGTIQLGVAADAFEFLIDQGSDPKRRGLARHALADLYLESAAGKKAGSRIATSGINASLEDVIQLYRELLAQKLNEREHAEGLYQLARAHEANDQIELALWALNRLVERFPKSDHYAEAQFRRSEIHFGNGNYTEAEKVIRKVLNRKRYPELYSRNLYLMGWIQLKQDRFSQAEKYFAQLLSHLLPTQATNPPLKGTDKRLFKDGARGMALSFMHRDGNKTAKQFFAGKKKQKYEATVFFNLAKMYKRQGRYPQAANTFLTFMKRNPNHKKAHIVHKEVIEAYRKTKNSRGQWRQMAAYATKFNTKGSYWKNANNLARKQIKKYIKPYLLALTKRDHSNAQKSGKSKDYRKAEKYYRQYLNTFPDEYTAAPLNFLLAELLYEIKDFPAAAKQYERTAYHFAPHDKSSEAGYAAMLTHELMMQREKKQEKLHGRIRKSINSGLLFAKFFPKDKRVSSVLTMVAEEQLMINDTKGAARTGRKLMQADPNLPRQYRRRIWTVIAHGEFELEEFSKAEQAYKTALTFKHQPKEKQPIIERLAETIYRQGEVARKNGQNKRAIQHFLRIGNSAPGSQTISVGLYDAATLYMDNKEWRSAISTLTKFRQDYPKHNLERGVTEKLALSYEKAEQWTHTATERRRLSVTEKDQSLAKELLWSAGDFYLKGKAVKEGINTFTLYLKRYRLPLEEQIEAENKIALLYLESKDHKNYHTWLKKIIRNHKNGGKKATNRTRYLAANATYSLAKISSEDFYQTPLNLPLQKSLTRKKRTMQKALNAFSKVLDFGIADMTTATTYHLAEIYHQLSKDLMHSERPKGLNDLELEQYGILLEEQAIPFEDKAIELHELNFSKIQEAAIFNDWIKKSMKELAEMMPARFSKPETIEVFVADIT